jgi:hypothetical protein
MSTLSPKSLTHFSFSPPRQRPARLQNRSDTSWLILANSISCNQDWLAGSNAIQSIEHPVATWMLLSHATRSSFRTFRKLLSRRLSFALGSRL